MAGADLSFLPQMESLGAEYRSEGTPVDPLDLFQDQGYGIVRLRLWHTPAEPWHGLDSVVAFAGRVTAAGYDWMLDIHYSDTWADPGHQTKPAAWAALDFGALVDSVYAYTNSVIVRCRNAGALPSCVQIGNEISPGMLWNDGRVGWPGSEWDTPEQWANLAALLSAGAAGARDSLLPEERPKIVIHAAEGGDNTKCRWFYDGLSAAGVDFDVIAVSFYPWWHGSLTDLSVNLHDLAARYGKEIQVVEASYPWTLVEYDTVGNFVTDESQLHPGYPATPEGQLAYFQDLIAIVRTMPDGLGTGFLYWEPAFLSIAGGPGNPHENLTLFDFDGDALPAVAFPEPRDSSSHASVQVVGDFNGWDTGAGGMTRVGGLVWMDTLFVEAGCHLFKFRTDGAWDVPLDYGSCSGEDAGCAVPAAGPVCPVSSPGTALGRIEFPLSAEYVFRLDEGERRYAIVPLSETAVAVSEDEGMRMTLSFGPNPFRGFGVVRFFLPRSSHADLAVYSVNGRLVRRLAEGVFSPGEHALAWDGMDAAGRHAPAGTYLIRLSAADETITERATLLR